MGIISGVGERSSFWVGGTNGARHPAAAAAISRHASCLMTAPLGMVAELSDQKTL